MPSPEEARRARLRASSAVALLFAAGIVGFFAISAGRRSPPAAPQVPEAHAGAVAASAAPDPAIDDGPPPAGDVPAFAFVDPDGHVVRESSLRGHVWIADFIFTTCTTMCPIVTAQMNQLRREITSPDVRFVSISIDPESDTPDVLKAYGARWSADPRWLLLRPDPDKVADFARAMHVPFEKTIDPQEPILHTTVFFLVDRTGRMLATYGSLDDAAMKRLVADATQLEGATDGADSSSKAVAKAPGKDTVSRGRALFQSLGCDGCHSSKAIAPPLAGLSGRRVELAGGATVVADAAYLRQSILAPTEKVTAGYNQLMPVYQGHLTGAETDDLVAYVGSLRPL